MSILGMVGILYNILIVVDIKNRTGATNDQETQVAINYLLSQNDMNVGIKMIPGWLPWFQQ